MKKCLKWSCQKRLTDKAAFGVHPWEKNEGKGVGRGKESEEVREGARYSPGWQEVVLTICAMWEPYPN